jgi:iron complex transport system substrate-binding protein
MTAPTSGAALRVAVLQPSVSIVLERLGRLDSIVACTRYCLESVPALQQRQVKVIADSWSASTEEILSVQPNLVLASVPYRLESLAAILKSGCPVLTLAPHSLADVYQDIRMLGSLLGANRQAEIIVDQMLAAIDAIREQAKQSATRPRVYCEEWGKPLIHSQRWVAELVSASGGEFIGDPGSVTSPEIVGEAEPDVLIFAWCGAGDRVPLARVVAKRDWQRLHAVRSGRVYCVPDQLLNTPAPNLMQGARALAGCIHPEIFGEMSGVHRLEHVIDIERHPQEGLTDSAP